MKEKKEKDFKFREAPPEMALSPVESNISDDEKENDVQSSNKTEPEVIDDKTKPVSEIQILLEECKGHLVRLQVCFDLINKEIMKQVPKQVLPQVPDQIPEKP